MKFTFINSKKLKMLSIFLIFLILLGTFFCYIDSKRIENGNTPLFAIYLIDAYSKEDHVGVYLGLGYKIYEYPAKRIVTFLFAPKDKDPKLYENPANIILLLQD